MSNVKATKPYYLRYSDALLYCKQVKISTSYIDKFNEVLNRLKNSGVKLIFDTPGAFKKIEFPMDMTICRNIDDKRAVPFFNIDNKLSRAVDIKTDDDKIIFTMRLTDDYIIFDNIRQMPLYLRYQVYNPLILTTDDDVEYVSLSSDNNRNPIGFTMNPVILMLMTMGMSCDGIIVVFDDLLNCNGTLEMTINEITNDLIEVKIPMNDTNTDQLIQYFNKLDEKSNHIAFSFEDSRNSLKFSPARIPSSLKILKSKTGKQFYFACDNILLDEYSVRNYNNEIAMQLSYTQSYLYMTFEFKTEMKLGYIWAPLFYTIPDAYKVYENETSATTKCEPRLRTHYKIEVADGTHKHKAVYQHIEDCKINPFIIWLTNVIADPSDVVLKVKI